MKTFVLFAFINLAFLFAAFAQKQGHHNTINSNPINISDSAANQDKKKKSIQKSRSDAQTRERNIQMHYQRQQALRKIRTK